jgi:hypothetical protein
MARWLIAERTLSGIIKIAEYSATSTFAEGESAFGTILGG